MTTSLNRLEQLRELGQSPWYDNIDRRLIDSGELKGLFDRGIVGVTSNPTIFEKAINGSDVYDGKIKALKARGLDLEQIFDELTADDVRDAADLLKGVWEKTQGVDGYVSIEVLPAYAHDAEKTVAYAKYIFKKVGRPNVMIKVPGTKESASAIRTLITEGIPVNVTLLFSLSQYEAAALAYWEGLEEGVRHGMDMSRVASVASVFISRIDTKIDGLLDSFALKEPTVEGRQGIMVLKGKTAIANAKMIYRAFLNIFSEMKLAELSMYGARPQRPLWASTGTKNSDYSDCIYVDNLIGPQTVNTMPHATVLAFEDHGRPSLTLASNLDTARGYLEAISRLGISVERVCEDAQKEGVQAFERSFATLMASLKAKVG
jgi:transaldolase